MSVVSMKHWAIFLTESSFPKIRLLLLITQCSHVVSYAQKHIDHQQQIWYGIYVNLRIHKRIHIASEIQERHFVQPLAQQQLLSRNQLVYRISPGLSGIAGFSYFRHHPQDPYNKEQSMTAEWRLELGGTNRQQFKHFTLQHRYRWESRFFASENNGQYVSAFKFRNFRLRYQLAADIPILKQKSTRRELIIIKLKEEIMINLGQSIIHNIFDQNRLSAGLYCSLLPQLGFEVGYMNLFQQQTESGSFYNRNILRLSAYYNI